MKFAEVHRHVKGIPNITPEKAKILYDFILEHRPMECLELGFAHGASACYTAAALDEFGGHITAVDLHRGKEWQDPSIESLLEKTGLGNRVTVLREHTSYTWFLKKKIESNEQRYDFCYIDGPKNFTIDGAAFFLVDKLLNENGYILFDDMNWAYGTASEWSAQKLEESGILVSQMDQDELNQPHIEAVFRLLVMQHPSYSNFVIDGDWGWAQKVRSDKARLVVKETGGRLERILRAIKGE